MQKNPRCPQIVFDSFLRAFISTTHVNLEVLSRPAHVQAHFLTVIRGLLTHFLFDWTSFFKSSQSAYNPVEPFTLHTGFEICPQGLYLLHIQN